MLASQFARSAYGSPHAPVRSDRQNEYDLFARVTRVLSDAAQHRQTDFPGFAAALNDNLILWRTLAADVSDDGNALPPPLRARLFYLYEFTAAHSRKVLAGQAGTEILVEINTSVMRGLRGERAPT
ncbi:flagellar biosynthesis regulatory protein FlaF [Gemmobacter lutimaris]|uniref:Flagellar biosynthesis regulatory protein FlaF n=1 Tax=Gemmobacter lutimaris TaxID=2306023 RepID=A0A398BQA2_9RHOB|nr:flagellar biosynthesis regulator FlaF [Gemmobacter lutimaris]RID90738.1 flagellar biosynthesis regulatory protein FlaF [Gemmobacter lutimaris]